jgi:NAD(P)-dependent dehydrogenase (short-subunit alcohol dehydrogenase family)
MTDIVSTRLPFGFDSTAAEVIDGIDLRGRRAIVTGGSSGIGVETARVLAQAGAEVTIAVRDLAAGQNIAGKIGHHVEVAHLDLSDQDSVRAFVNAWNGPLHLLINNAGVMATPETYTAAGWELQFATNHLGHFALATGLHQWLAAEGGRVVSVSSRGHLMSDVHLSDLHFQHRPYDRWLAYGQSKTANILFAVEANRRWQGITANAVHPGRIMTNLVRYLNPEHLALVPTAGGGPDRIKTVEQGAATSVLVATSPRLGGIGGRYFEDCNEAGPNVAGTRTGYAAYALDPISAEALWDASVRLISSRLIEETA